MRLSPIRGVSRVVNEQLEVCGMALLSQTCAQGKASGTCAREHIGEKADTASCSKGHCRQCNHKQVNMSYFYWLS
eukprot:6456830-Amphidinium_carterae.2